MPQTQSAAKPAPSTAGRLGTFSGVFTPSILTILGLVLFLKLGEVVGEVGLGAWLLIFLFAYAICLLTSISLSAIATNLRVKSGGDYYLISRTLGVEFGGALGVVVYLAQSVSIAFYTIGFGEALSNLLQLEGPYATKLCGVPALAALFLLAWAGSDWATRFQYVIMATLAAGLGVFFVGGSSAWQGDVLTSNWSGVGGLSFWGAFALFFPAVTGFTQGVSMSGDLADPGKSLPRGTLIAVGLSAVVYIAVALVLCASLEPQVLSAEGSHLRMVASVPWLIDAGVIAATLSSGLASFLGAPRILQSLATDRVFPFLRPFAVGVGPANNPRRGVLLSAGIALVFVLSVDLDDIANVVTVFFLISYGLLNYATYYEASSKSPSFRPRFRFYRPRWSLLGGLCCMIAILAISPTAGAFAFAFLLGIHQYLAYNDRVERWSDSDVSSRYQRVRDYLHGISGEVAHARDWRPVILAFSEDAGRRERIIRFASWIEGGAGFTTAVRMIEGDGAAVRKERKAAEAELAGEIAAKELEAFPLVVAAADMQTGFPVLLQSAGLGPIRPNIVLMNWFDQERISPKTFSLRRYGRYVRRALRADCNVVLLSVTTEELLKLAESRPSQRRIDVWWRDDASGRLSLLLAFLMLRSKEWKEARLRVITAPDEGATQNETLERVRQMLNDVRIEAEPVVVTHVDSAAMRRESGGSSVVFLPFRIEDEEPVAVFGDSLEGALGGLPISAMVLASRGVVLDAEPDEGPQARIAEATDRAKRSEELACAAEQQVIEAEERGRALRERLAKSEELEAEERTDVEAELAAADGDADKARRRAVKARAKADTAATEAAALASGAEAPEEPEPRSSPAE